MNKVDRIVTSLAALLIFVIFIFVVKSLFERRE